MNMTREEAKEYFKDDNWMRIALIILQTWEKDWGEVPVTVITEDGPIQIVG